MFAVAGVTGKTGGAVADALVAKGQKVRAIVRTDTQADVWRSRGADVAIASLDDGYSLARALDGATAAYLLLPTNPASDDIIAKQRRTVDSLAVALKVSDVPRVVFLSSIGAQHAHGTGIVRTLHYAEQRLAEVCRNITFLRSAYFLENWIPVLGLAATGHLPTFIRPDQETPMVATRDIGILAADSLSVGGSTDPSRVIEIAGPHDYTPRQIAAVLARLYGKPVKVEASPLEAVVPAFAALGASASVAEQYRLLFEAYRNGIITPERHAAHIVRGATDAAALFAPLVDRNKQPRDEYLHTHACTEVTP